MTTLRRYLRLLALPALLVTAVLPHAAVQSAAGPIRVGAAFPLHNSMGALGREEYEGVNIARRLVNADGGVTGRQIVLDTREFDTPSLAPFVMSSFHAKGDAVVVGSYSSALSIPAAAAASRIGMVYWEAGAVADRLTGQGLQHVFRVGASGSNLGVNSANFAAGQLAPRLGKAPGALRVAVVSDDDDYALSVASAAVRRARARGLRVVSWTRYNAYAPHWDRVVAAVKAAHPNILILASHIPDGVAFRRSFLAAHIYVDAFIGSTMAQCVPEFGALMGKDAVGVFASDRPEGGFNPTVLNPSARAVYNRFAALWYRQTGEKRPSEEAVAGFTAGWVLFHDVLPQAARSGALTPASISAAARSLDLPNGSLPNGAGLRFGSDRHHMGQNLRAAAVIWQWQAVRHSVVVWPPQFATGTVKMVPLPR